MQRVVINCQTGQSEVIELSPKEESDRLAEIELSRQQEIIRRRLEIKRLLVKELAELREMRQNRTLFDDTDVAEKQAEVDRLTLDVTRTPS